MPETQDWKGLAEALARMARDLLAQDSVQNTLDQVVRYAVDLVDGCEAAGVLAVREGRVLTLAVTDDVARVSDRMQAELREGPCFDAVAEQQQTYRVADMTVVQPRWPTYAPRARELGVGSMMGFLLFTDTALDLGALNLYSSRPGAFTGQSEQVGWLLASHAAVALASSRTNAELLEAIGTRQGIGEALGILMERHKIDERQAFTRLKRVSQNRNIKIRELADTINRTGELPDGKG